MRVGKFVAEWRHPLGIAECPYAYRWRLDFYFFSFRIHKWIGSDDTRAFHNHPWHFITFILKGYYFDWTPWGEGGEKCQVVTSWAWRNKDHRHYVDIPKNESPVWTFIITFGAPRRYAFWDVITGKRKNRDKYFIEHGHPPCE